MSDQVVRDGDNRPTGNDRSQATGAHTVNSFVFDHARSKRLSQLSDDLEQLSVPIRIEEPRDFILVRHAQSDRNYKKKLEERGALTAEMKEWFDKQEDNHARITNTGRMQAIKLGEWWKSELNLPIHHYFCSYHVRPVDTLVYAARAAGVSDIKIRRTSLIGERLWGNHDQLSESQRAIEEERREINPRMWTPFGGESLRLVEAFSRLFYGTAHRKMGGQGVMAVCHGEFITSTGSIIERWDEDRLSQEIKRGVPNCGVVHYSRVNPETGVVDKNINWVRRACPWKLDWKDGVWSGEWHKIMRPEWSLDELEADIARYPRFEESFPNLPQLD